MIEAISGSLSQAAVAQPTSTNQAIEALDAPAQEPNSAMVADFTKAISPSDPPVANPASSDAAVSRDTQPSAALPAFEIEATVPAKDIALTKRMSREASSFVDHLNSLTPEPGAPDQSGTSTETTHQPSLEEATDGKGATGASHVLMDGSINELERAYASITEAALASTGSTQASNVFNTLLKGQ